MNNLNDVNFYRYSMLIGFLKRQKLKITKKVNENNNPSINPKWCGDC